MAVLSAISTWAIPFLLAFIPIYGWLRGVPVYEAFVEGAEEGVRLTAKLAPFLIAILVALGIFRDSGAMGALIQAVGPYLSPLGVPPEVVPLMVTRPLSGGGALGVTAELLKTHGPDSWVGLLASTIQGSTDTTFYVLSVYFGSIGIRQARWALPVGLIGDAAAFVGALLVWHWIGHP